MRTLRFPDGRIDSLGNVYLDFNPGLLPLNPDELGARGDAISIDDATMGALSDSLTSASALFTKSDVGKTILVMGAGAGGEPLITTIASYVNPSNVLLTAPSVGAVGPQTASWGTDNYQAFFDTMRACVASGRAMVTTAGRYLIAQVLNLPDYLTWYGNAETTLIAALPRIGLHSACDLLLASFSPLTTFDAALQANVPQWATTISVDVAPAVGNDIRIVSGHAGPLEEYSGIYTVMAVSAGPAPFTVTVDRPIVLPYIAATAQGVTYSLTRPRNIYIYGNGMLLTGSAGRLIECLGGLDCEWTDMRFDSSGGTAGRIGSIDEGSYNCTFRRLRGSMTIQSDGNPTIGLMSESSESCEFDRCEVFRGARDDGIMLFDCAFMLLNECRVEGDGTNPALACLRLGTWGWANGRSVGCKVRGGSYSGGLAHSVYIDVAEDTLLDGVEACKAGGVLYGIYATANSVRSRASGCTISANPTGVYVDSGGDLALDECTLEDNHFGLFAVGIVKASNCTWRAATNNGNVAGPAAVEVLGGGRFTGVACKFIADNAGAHPPIIYMDDATSRLFLTDCHIAMAASDAAMYGVLLTNGVAVLDNLTIDGAAAGISAGVRANGGTVRYKNLDADACSSPISSGGGYLNHGQVTANGSGAAQAITWPDLKSSDTVLLVRVSNAGAFGYFPMVNQTPATGFSVTFNAAETSVWQYVVE